MDEIILIRPDKMPSRIGLTKEEYKKAWEEYDKQFIEYAKAFEENFPELVEEITTDE